VEFEEEYDKTIKANRKWIPKGDRRHLPIRSKR
jgi:hypothetical protein